MSACPAFCPHCGTDFARLPRVIERGEWRIGDRWAERGQDGKVMLTDAEASALRTIAALPGIVAAEAVANRASHAGDPANAARNLVCRLRGKLAGLPVEGVYGVGYRWKEAV